jgi:flagellar motor switch protein FliN/FliY
MTTDSDPSQGVPSESSGTARLPKGQESLFANLGSSDDLAEISTGSETAGSPARLDLVLDIPVRLSVELGRAEMPIRDVANLGRGSVIELDGSPGQPLDVRVNGVLIGRGEVVVIDEERLGLRFIEVVRQTERPKRPK